MNAINIREGDELIDAKIADGTNHMAVRNSRVNPSLHRDSRIATWALNHNALGDHSLLSFVASLSRLFEAEPNDRWSEGWKGTP